MTIQGQSIMHTPKTVLGFNGELFEPTTGHYVLGNGYRAYSPLLMIFIQPDSWSPFGAGGLNAYAYCKGDPVNAADPTGHMPFPNSRPWNFRWIQPPPSPNHSRPGSPFTARQEFPLLDNFPEQPVMAPAAVVGSSPTGLAPAPASPLRPTSPSRQPYPSSSALPTPAGSAGRPWVVPRSYRNKINYRSLQKEIGSKILSHDAAGIIDLSKKPLSRIPVLREVRWRLLRSPGERRAGIGERKRAPKLLRGDLLRLEDQARVEGSIEKAEFYANLRDGFFPLQ
nr:RHS repeat-associated core domain-containing protein [Pseudomonas bharatica]